MSAVAERLYALRRTVSLVAQHPGRFLLATLLAGAALALPLTTAIFAVAAVSTWNSLAVGPEISVFARVGTSSRELDALGARLAAMEGVSGVRVIPRDQALAELSKRSGLAAAPSDGRSNPLPDTLVARFPATIDPAVIGRTAERVRQWSGVDSVQADIGWYRRLVDLRGMGLTIAACLGALTALLVFAAVLASIVLVAQLPRDEVRVLRWAGARPSFVRRPYVYASSITLTAAALLALALAAALRMAGPHAGLPVLTPPHNLPGWLYLATIGGAGFFGAILGHVVTWAQMCRFRPW